MREARSPGLGTVLALVLVLVWPAGSAGAAIGSPELKLHALVNDARWVQGLGTLSVRDRLSRIAERHTRRMADRRVLFHSDLGETLPGASAGEVVGYGTSVDAVFTELMASGSHRDILLGTAWLKTGVGVVRHGGRVWVTQIVRD
ncbi:MAG: CAP domain-containing protein [Actinomycetota bacterium]